MKTKTGNAQGFSLVEVVLALGLLAGVMISIAGMFALAGKDLNSGRNSTEALAVARGILEEMDGWGFRQTYGLFGMDGAAQSYTIDTRTNAYASKWQPTLDETLFQSNAEILIESLSSGAVPNLDATRAMRVTVTVFWTEGERPRQVVLSTVRL